MATKKPTKAQQADLKKYEAEGFSPEPGWEQYINTELGTPAASADVQNMETGVGNLLNKGAAPAKAEPAKKKAASPVSADQTLQEFANTLAQKYASQPLQAIGQEGTTLANENKAVTEAITPFLTGSTKYNAGGSASPDVQAAMDAYSKAYATGEGVNSAAYANMGLANEQFLAASPESAYLQLLSQPGSAYYKQIPSSLMSQLPESLQYALEHIGLVGQGAVDTPPKGGWSKAVQNEFGVGGNSSVASSLLSGLGTVPGAPTSPNSLGTTPTGNPATPGG